MTRETSAAVYLRRLNEALFESGESQLISGQADDFFNSNPSFEDVLLLKHFGAEQAAPRDLAEAFERTFGAA